MVLSVGELTGSHENVPKGDLKPKSALMMFESDFSLWRNHCEAILMDIEYEMNKIDSEVLK